MRREKLPASAMSEKTKVEEGNQTWLDNIKEYQGKSFIN